LASYCITVVDNALTDGLFYGKGKQTKKNWEEIYSKRFESELQNRQYVYGDKFKSTDCFIGYTLYLANSFGVLDAHPILAEYYKRVSDRPAFMSSFIANKIMMVEGSGKETLGKTPKAEKTRKVETWESHVVEGNETEFTTVRSNYLWTIIGPFGPLETRTMTIYKMKGTDQLLIISAIALKEETIQKLEALGKPTILICPNGFHKADAGVFKQRYPNLKIYCPMASVDLVKKMVDIDGTCEDAASEWASLGVHPRRINGAKPFELVYELDLDNDNKAVYFSDVIMNMRAKGPKKLLVGNSPRIPRIVLLPPIGFVSSTTELQKWVVSFANEFKDDQLKAIIFGHGAPIGDDCKKLLLDIAYGPHMPQKKS